MKILIIGKGYLGVRCHESWEDSVITDKRVNTKEDVLELIEEYKPDAILNAAGVVGKPNVDWCETHQMETIEGNTVLPFIIAKACAEKNVYMLHMGTGCIFYGENPSGKPWKENDAANPVAVYTRAKYAADICLATMPNIGIARIRMPLDNHSTRSNLVDKLASFEKVIDVENSLTVVEDMIKVFHELMEKKAEGVFHTVNRGSITHKEIMSLYEKYVDPNHKNEWITEGELVSCGLVAKKRSNNIMGSENLEKYGLEMPDVHESVEKAMKEYSSKV